MKKKIYSDYAELKTQIATLQEKLADLQPKIIEDMKSNQIDKLPTEFGNFNISQRSYWSYSDDLKAEVAKMQKKEQATGKAEQKITETLTFKA